MEPIGEHDVEGELGRGAMGRVLLARDRRTGAARAIKVLAGSLDAEAVLRFQREAETLGRLRGAGVVPIHQSGLERGQLYIVMDVMPGGSLRARLKRVGALPRHEAVAIALAVARTLERCHALGIIHRDVKPENILFDDQDQPRLADFGIARDLGASRLTQTGIDPGTPSYMAPELLRGEKASPATDVYALGVVLHEMVAGALPGAPGSAPPSRDLERLLTRALAEDTRARFPDAASFATELERALSSKEPGDPGPRSRAAGIALAGLLVALGGGAVARELAGRTSLPTPEPVRPTRSPDVAATSSGGASPAPRDVDFPEATHAIASEPAAVASGIVGRRVRRSPGDALALATRARDRAIREARLALDGDPSKLVDDVVRHALEADAFTALAAALAASLPIPAEVYDAARAAADALDEARRAPDLARYRLLRRASERSVEGHQETLAHLIEEIVLVRKYVPIAQAREDMLALEASFGRLGITNGSVGCALGRLFLASDETARALPAEAEKHLRPVLGLDAGKPDGRYIIFHWLACALLDLGRSQEARSLIEHYEGPRPGRYRFMKLPALIALELGLDNEARSILLLAAGNLDNKDTPETAREAREWVRDLEGGHREKLRAHLREDHRRDEHRDIR